MFNDYTYRSVIGLSLYSIVVTVRYSITRDFEFFQLAYGFLALIGGTVPLYQTFVLSKKYPDRVRPLFKLYAINIVSYATGFVLWQIENFNCDQIRLLRDRLGPFGVLLQLHAWWHMLTGLGGYGTAVHVHYMRLLVLGRTDVRLTWFGIYPVVLPIDEKNKLE